MYIYEASPNGKCMSAIVTYQVLKLQQQQEWMWEAGV